MDGCNPNPGSDSTAEIRNEERIKDVTDIILTLWLLFSVSQIRAKKEIDHSLHPTSARQKARRPGSEKAGMQKMLLPTSYLH